LVSDGEKRADGGQLGYRLKGKHRGTQG